MDAELAISGRILFRKDYAMTERGVGVAILVKAAFPAVPNHPPDITHNDVLACDTSSPNGAFSLVCIYRPTRGNSQNNGSRLTLLRTSFDGSHPFIQVGNLKAGHIDWGHSHVMPFDHRLTSSYLTWFTTLLRFSTYVKPRVPPSFLNVLLTKDD